MITDLKWAAQFQAELEEAFDALDRGLLLEASVLLRRRLEGLFRKATEEEKTNYPTLFSRIAGAMRSMQADRGLQHQVHETRKLMNRVVHETGNQRPEPEDLYRSTMAILITLRALVPGLELSQRLVEFEKLKARYAWPDPKKPASGKVFKEMVRAIVLEVGPVRQNRFGGREFDVTCRAEDSLEGGDTFRLTLGQFVKEDGAVLYDFLYLFHLLKPQDLILCHNVELVMGEGSHMRTTARSVIVLDPDFMVEASELADSFMMYSRHAPNLDALTSRETQFKASPLHTLVNKLVPRPKSPNLFRGSLVNFLLDSLLEGREPDFKALLTDFFRSHYLRMAAFGRQQVSDIANEVRLYHWPNILKIAKELKETEGSIMTEATYISPEYGVTGRLDILVEYGECAWDVIELKSGKQPHNRFGLPTSNRMQLACQDLILDQIARKRQTRRNGTSALFFTGHLEDEKVNPITGKKDRKAVLADKWDQTESFEAMIRPMMEARNAIVSAFAALQRGDVSCLTELTHPDQDARFSKFDKEDLLPQLDTFLQAAQPDAAAYYQAFLTYLFRELFVSKVGGGTLHTRADARDHGYAGLWLDGEDEKRSRFELLCPLRFQESHGGVIVFSYQPEENEHHHSFRPGDIVTLYPVQDAFGFSPSHHQLARGSVVELEGHRVSFRFKSALTDDYFQKHPVWAAEPDVYDSNQWGAIESLWRFLKAASGSHPLVDILLGRQEPTFRALPIEPAWQDDRLTPARRQLLRHALEACEVFVLQGPPGTGKTSQALVELVQQELALGRKTVTVLCFTTRATDEVAEKLERLQSEGKFKLLHLNRKGQAADQLEGLLNGREMKLESITEGVREHRVILSTIATFYNRADSLESLFGGLDLLIVDEASQVTEAQLSGILPMFRKVILIGDDNQLPPVTVVGEALCRVEPGTELGRLGFTDMRDSLFDRLMRRFRRKPELARYHGMLEEHFRMHEAIAGLINPYYEGRLQSRMPRQGAEFSLYKNADEGYCRALSGSRVVFIETHNHEPAQKRHPLEARLVAELCRDIRRQCPHASIGVVTPWRAQIREINLALEAIQSPSPSQGNYRAREGEDAGHRSWGSGKGDSDIKVDTVERFQGSERDVIILSLATNQRHFMASLQSLSARLLPDGEFLEVDRKLVVALSRAREQVIILGHAPLLMGNPHYGPILKRIREMGGMVEMRLEELNSLEKIGP